MSEYQCKFLADCMGLSTEQAQRVFDVLQRVQLVSPEALARWERDERIFHMKGDGLDARVLSDRFQITRRAVFLLIANHARKRRDALRVDGAA